MTRLKREKNSSAATNQTAINRLSGKLVERLTSQTGLSSAVIAIGAVSLCTDLGTKMIYPLLPLYLTTTLGAPAAIVGIVEGLAESSASVLKLFSGILADRIGQHKRLALIGYGMGAIAQVILALSFSWPSVLFARLTDRVGKGIRSTPRDLLIIHNSEENQRSSAFGLHHSLESIGEVVGPLLAALLLMKLAVEYRWIFAIALLPSAVGLWVLARFVPRLKQKPGDRKAGPVAFRWRGTSRPY
ncbi:MAG: MFS transporter, partial [Cyanobacteria bacterium P01_F01_bin.42]